MQKKDCFLLGTIFKLHSYKGCVQIYTNNILNLNSPIFEYLLVEIDNTLIPFFVKKIIKKKKNILSVSFEDVKSKEDALKMLQKKVYIPSKWLSEKEKYKIKENDIIGYTISDIHLGFLGRIKFINTQTPQHIIYANHQDKEFCFPMHDKFVKKIDHENKIIHTSIPESIIYLN